MGNLRLSLIYNNLGFKNLINHSSFMNGQGYDTNGKPYMTYNDEDCNKLIAENRYANKNAIGQEKEDISKILSILRAFMIVLGL